MQLVNSGSPFFIAIEFEVGYNVANAQSIEVFLDEVLIGEKGQPSMVQNGNVFTVVLDPSTGSGQVVGTADLNGNYVITLKIDDATSGQNVFQSNVAFGSAQADSLSIGLEWQVSDRTVGLVGIKKVVTDDSNGSIVESIEIQNKKDGDTIAHNLSGNVAILGFVPSGESELLPGWRAEPSSADEFILRTGLFGSDALQTFNGNILICKYGEF